MELEQRYLLTIILFIVVIGSFILMMLAIKNSGKRKATSLVNLKPEKKKDYGDYLKEAMEQPDFKDSQLCKSILSTDPIDVNTLKFQNQQFKDLIATQQKLINVYEKVIEEKDKVILEYKKIHT